MNNPLGVSPSNELLVLKKTSEISFEIVAEFGFFPVSTKMKAQ